ncbi:hypothetical protein E0Z10_g9035 [Xylaria hypoxylon]|uniref:Rhodopsin domain-containing protein n=1 Tax=Xylaria hypoxylon TaxID=37992 RepID=A0A4Z0YM78_9PEZI|nr:hypothetical protein E0Z10_g9035 [Xylaria hypoxylon]
MDNGQQIAPAGDIGNHVLPQVIVILTGVIALVALTVRLLARQFMRRLGIADLLLVISMVFYLVHHYNAYQAAIYPGLGSFKIASVFFGLNIVFLKIAILFDWINTFVPTDTRNPLFWTLQSLIWSNTIFYLIGTFIEAFQCPPEDINTPRCNIDVVKYNLTSGVINVLSDLTILIAPHWVIWKLNLSKIKKIGVSVLFLIGALATGSAIARVVYITSAYRTGDILFNVMPINLWAIAEQTFGYLVIGVPATPKVLHDFPCAKHLGSLVRSRSKPTSNPSRGYYDGGTWPGLTLRRYGDGWETGDMDTHVLVIIHGRERTDIQLPGMAQLHGRYESQNSSADAVTKQLGWEQKGISSQILIVGSMS